MRVVVMDGSVDRASTTALSELKTSFLIVSVLPR